MFEDNVTVYNRFGPAKVCAFSAHDVKGVHFECEKARGAASPLSKNGGTARAIIPFSSAESYISPAAWEKLLPEERAYYFTLQTGDVIAPQDAARDAGFIITSVFERGTNAGGTAHFDVQAKGGARL